MSKFFYMNTQIEIAVVQVLGANKLERRIPIQSLWSGYGSLDRYLLEGCQYDSVIVKEIQMGKQLSHPRNWNTDHGHARKQKSYQVERYWYQHFQDDNANSHRFPKMLANFELSNCLVLVLEDLDSVGYQVRHTQVRFSQMQLVIEWLASFHAHFLGRSTKGLWEVGTYWHLATRQQELDCMEKGHLKNSAAAIDEYLTNLNYQTIVHGDAKLANFCFASDNSGVAGVDFQYVGGGCGMKDLAYLVGSCLHEEECEQFEDQLLTEYFQTLRNHLPKDVNFVALETEWRQAYPLAWADFHRFLKGWSPGHWKINSYSERMCQKAIQILQSQ